MIGVAGVDHIITLDLHSPQIQGFLSVPLHNLFAEPTLAHYIRTRIPDFSNGVIVAKNAGGVKR